MASIFSKIPGLKKLFNARESTQPLQLHVPELPPNTPDGVDPYQARWDTLRELLNDLSTIEPQQTKPFTRILFFSTMDVWTDASLATAVALAGYGCEIDFVWHPMPHDHENMSELERIQLTRSVPGFEHPQFHFYNLLQIVVDPPIKAMIEIAKKVSWIDTQYLCLREAIDPQNAEKDRQVYEFRMRRNLETITALAKVIQHTKYDRVVTPNGIVLDFGAAYQTAKLFGLDCSTIELHDRKYHIHASQNEPVLSQDNAAAWKADEPHIASKQRHERVDQFLQSRTSGNWAEYFWRCQSAPMEAAGPLLTQLQLNAEQPIGVLCANVANDSVVLGRNRTFQSMADWIRQTIDFFADHPEWQLIIRAHPAEQVQITEESVEWITSDHCPGGLPTNVRVVKPADPINTYSLIGLSHIAMVYNSTVGLEMTTYGLPVIVVGQSHYGLKGFTLDPETPDVYRQVVKECMSKPRTLLTSRQKDLARCYLDMYFNVLPFPFPWIIGDIHFNDWPISRVLAEEGRNKFQMTFDFLAGREVHYAERLRHSIRA
jgi:hypothetical protein